LVIRSFLKFTLTDTDIAFEGNYINKNFRFFLPITDHLIYLYVNFIDKNVKNIDDRL